MAKSIQEDTFEKGREPTVRELKIQVRSLTAELEKRDKEEEDSWRIPPMPALKERGAGDTIEDISRVRKLHVWTDGNGEDSPEYWFATYIGRQGNLEYAITGHMHPSIQVRLGMAQTMLMGVIDIFKQTLEGGQQHPVPYPLSTGLHAFSQQVMNMGGTLQQLIEQSNTIPLPMRYGEEEVE